MRPQQYDPAALLALFHNQQVATMPEMKSVLGTRVDMTVFRKLRSLGYCSSYSNGGKFYTLLRIAEFDTHGLWKYNGVCFSESGSLIDTAEHLVLKSEAGLSAKDLDCQVGVECKGVLLQLVLEERLSRVKLGRQYLYCSCKKRKQGKQISARTLLTKRDARSYQTTVAEYSGVEVQAAAIIFMSLLNEKQRRLFAGFESIRAGEGGDTLVSEWLHVDRRTVARGRKELAAGEIDFKRIRKDGAGRKSSKKNS